MESGGVRKGAWSMEEDILLTKCIEKYGEGNWHRVPLRAGLNRCRKSCRLRWLNYLRPGIKRGQFTLDEIDLMMRLHKLLGNRWSLIAGRLPGRTANDVKNYWNTHLLKRMGSCSDEGTAKARLASKTEIVKPQPWHFSKSLSGLRLKPKIVDNVQSQGSHSEASPTLPQPNDETTGWESLLAYSHKGDQGDDLIASLWAEAAVPTANVVEEFPISPIYDFACDVALWDIC